MLWAGQSYYRKQARMHFKNNSFSRRQGSGETWAL